MEEKSGKEEAVTEVTDGGPTNGGGGGGGSNARGNGASEALHRPKRARGGKNSKSGSEVVENSRFHCNYCNRDLSSTIRARCAVCTDFDLCLDCFSVGATLHPHEPGHAYRLVEIVTKPIYSESWGADEEERLLEGLETYGVGNWEDIAKVIQTRNKRETENHFDMIYLQSDAAPIPEMNRTTLLPKDDPEWEKEEPDPEPKDLKVMHLHQNGDLAGWMEKREDFVYEWNNEAEDVIAEMEITDTDSPEEKKFKAKILEIYNKKLEERIERKEFVLARKMLDIKAVQAEKRPREEKELRDKMKVFARFFKTHDEHQAFIKNVFDEKSVRQEVEDCCESRKLGATTSSERSRLNTNRSRNRPSLMDDVHSTGSRRRSAAAKSLFPRQMDGDVNTNSGTNGCLQSSGQYNNLEGAELLSRSEVGLCRSMKMSFHQYMIIKDVVIREARNKSLNKKYVKNLVKLDSSKVIKILEFFAACRWISLASGSAPNTPNPGTPGGQTKAVNGVVR
eukprot:Plantae.Rhodophyta-Purpureofilum_apyrenoidigerum.ctg19165.p1 GENE.Plantae.Rhodophyta-Purpureofilum_apyrenoidigerum.ctg19165~~Plantae.Rhodophyta-Purpureofilum_apyrenoidigerum.ctg19165.p1  ORF type:complete len:507 (+),score=106.23 Plantae.Rhodophyta-Purpureofilum_apyrenoidigerum.ctg19165:49-1569(+)